LIEGKEMASDCWLIVGLGNPGKQYEGTRHNMGFMCADVIAQRWSISMSDHKGLAKLGKGLLDLDGKHLRFFLAKPLTFMNESGNAVASITAYYDIDPRHVVVIHDDMDLEYGRIKVKSGGSAGGHNGIKSIDKSLGSNAYGRVRLGVGHSTRQGDAHRNTVNWVLGGFSREQQAKLPEFLADGADAAETLIVRGLAAAQESFNGR
jgi:PTH1 family peptidyl-tRNA hydrolase